MAATPDQVRAVIGKYVEAWTNKDRALLLSIFAEDAVWMDPVGTPAFTGRDGVARFWDFAQSGPKRSLTPKVEEIRACGNEGIMRFTMQVRIPEANQGLDLSVIDYFLINDQGLIQVAKAFWDESSVSCPAGMTLFAPNVSEAHQS